MTHVNISGLAYSEQEDCALIQLRKSGKTYAQIAAYLGRSRESVRCRYRRLQPATSSAESGGTPSTAKLLNGDRVAADEHFLWHLESESAELRCSMDDIAELHNSAIQSLLEKSESKLRMLQATIVEQGILLSQQRAMIKSLSGALSACHVNLDDLQPRLESAITTLQDMFDEVRAI